MLPDSWQHMHHQVYIYVGLCALALFALLMASSATSCKHSGLLSSWLYQQTYSNRYAQVAYAWFQLHFSHRAEVNAIHSIMHSLQIPGQLTNDADSSKLFRWVVGTCGCAAFALAIKNKMRHLQLLA